MSKSNTTARSNRRTARPADAKGTTPKVIEQPTEVAVEDSKTPEQEVLAPLPDSAAEVVGAETAPAEAPVAEQVVVSSDTTPETTEDQAPEQPIADIFADLPMVTLGEYQFRDLTTVGKVSNPRKYEGVHRQAVEQKLPVKKGWKHSASMITVGTHQREFKPTSVYGTIDRLVRNEGRAGIPAAVLVAKVRQAQIGNKRSHYCTELPPIGWAEGWIDSYISKNHGKIMAKPAPALTTEEIAEIKEGDAEALAEAEAIRNAA